ncbi:MAG: alpha/beta fold hydrolase [Gammaproteobacteria bacterium]|nr:alpha/beta fold hydrolase [Gammaproteobacteria bacterium]MBU0785330.1 alpha/beta fold hydrolase [Gammaproteobacteria bacterium]MBU0815913.1 alpha/beta fold hydrolase [Gammaproteobacteria bacterium]MBU1787452.1 alpha/beta fold hydrolase [Gammaproteobacteria bacterium]
MKPSDVLLLPGWQNSGPAHWQSRWETARGYQRVQQHDWARPLRGDWLMQLEEAVLRCEGPAVLVAHSLGCIQVAAWAAHTKNAQRVQAALLVAPGDVEREEMRNLLPSWAPIVRQTLPFSSLLVASRNDPYCRFERASEFAKAWGAALVDLGEAGHINADAGLGDWPQGLGLLQQLAPLAVLGLGKHAE